MGFLLYFWNYVNFQGTLSDKFAKFSTLYQLWQVLSHIYNVMHYHFSLMQLRNFAADFWLYKGIVQTERV